MKHIFTTLFACAALMACSDNEYTSNDPTAAPDAPAVYNVDDLKLNYSMFFKPSNGWTGDPMPYFENGKFHVFYLQDARDGAPTFHPIYGATTTNFLSYEDNGEMIACGEDNSREDALGTGSVFKEGDTYYFFYTAHNANLDPKEEIFLATSKDLKNWEKKGYVQNGWGDGYDRNDFRDPFIIKNEDGTYTMLVTTRADYKGSWRAVLSQFTSDKLTEGWTRREPFYDSEITTNLECPDVFVMGGYQYLIFSEQNDRRGVHYVYRPVGTTDWTVPANNFLDGYAYYAAKTASDGTNRYLFGWCPTRDDASDYNNYSWAGALVVHQLGQKTNGELTLSIPSPVNQALSNKVSSNSYSLKATDEKAVVVFPRFEKEAVNKISATVKANSAKRFGLEFGAGGSRKYVYDLVLDTEAGKIKLDYVVNGKTERTFTEARLPEAVNGEYRLTVVVENSVCVAYVNNEVALTNRIYQMTQNPWAVFAEDGEADFTVELYR
ncbi:glycoside hydrolase family 32 protein [Bacteroides sp. 224]|uniref:glycoside hydrolase family 32 protein n=1 Tax=Bacteroides sp. 224 TaxID=2302936 RepID=UPI0013D1D814|nr:glycoside hydrolase family 32 protein [Bacteroides sp. 224]NDV65425.1 DUF4975 domain-containing protein [Bacteroides sp. 224]